MKTAPMTNVRTNHSRRPHGRPGAGCRRDAPGRARRRTRRAGRSPRTAPGSIGVGRRERDVRAARSRSAQSSGLTAADREVHREQCREEHQLRGEPDDGSDADHVRSVDGRRCAGCRLHCCSCCRHGRHCVSPRPHIHPRVTLVSYGVRRNLRAWSPRLLPCCCPERPSTPPCSPMPARRPPPAAHHQHRVDGLDVRAGPGPGHRRGGRPVPRTACRGCAPAATAGPGGARVFFVPLGLGTITLAMTSRAGHVRRGPVLGPHAPAHDPGDDRADLPGRGRPGHPGAAHAAPAAPRPAAGA